MQIAYRGRLSVDQALTPHDTFRIIVPMANITDAEALIQEALKLELEDRQALLRALLPRIYSARLIVLGPLQTPPEPRIRKVIMDEDAGVFVDANDDVGAFLDRVMVLFFPSNRQDVRLVRETQHNREILSLELDVSADETRFLYLTEILPQHLDYFHISACGAGSIMNPADG